MRKLDDASFHIGANGFPEDAPEENGATHIGMFLTWAIRKGLFMSTDAPRTLSKPSGKAPSRGGIFYWSTVTESCFPSS